MDNKKCLHCGDPIYGRADKKFCSDQCRNNHNNKLNRDTNNLVRNVHNLLRKNRRILGDLYEGGNRKLHKDALFVTGFNFNFFTHLIEKDDATISRYCYEYGYEEISDDNIVLLKDLSVVGQ